MRRYSCRIAFGVILTLGIISFEVMIPYVIGWIIDATKKDRDGEYTKEQYDDEISRILKVGLSTVIVSNWSRWVQNQYLGVQAAFITSKIRYDLFYWYFKRCSEQSKSIDQQASQKQFLMNDLQKEIEVLNEHITWYMPQRLKHRLMVIACFICLFYVSW